MLKEKIKSVNFWLYFGLSILLFWTLIFTKSRSGFLGFGVACIIFWGAVAWQNVKNLKPFIAPLFIAGFTFISICLISGTQFTPSIYSLIHHSTIQPINQSTTDTALESGGTESGTIREIVWTGAVKLWENYPIFGTGVETFGYSYYLYRPAAHNMTSEWNFIYNKAHNEFLNFAANSGSVGLLTYLIVIGFSIYIFIKTKNYDLLAGYISLSVSNFFGFSVVPTQLQFFLFPAIGIVLSTQELVLSQNKNKINNYQKSGIIFLLLITSYLLLITYNYWYADTQYAKGQAFNNLPRPDLAIPVLANAIKLEPGQAIYYGELANSYTTIADAYSQNKDATTAAEFTTLAANTIQKSVDMAPANTNLRRSMFSVYVRLSTVDGSYLTMARDSLRETVKLAPTDAKLYYNLGIADANLNDFQDAENDFQTAIKLKPDYTDARIEYAALLHELGKNEEARTQLEYALKIDPGNATVKADLANIK